jgi:cell division protein FtsW
MTPHRNHTHTTPHGIWRYINGKQQIADRWLTVAIVILAAIGILMVYDSSVAISQRDFGNAYHFVREQIKWFVIGFSVFTLFSFIKYTVWKHYALPFFLGTLVLLVAVFVPGFGIQALGAHRWINFGFFILQPAELAKCTLVIYLSAWFSTNEEDRFVAFLLLMCMVLGLIMLEPDMGTSLLLLFTSLSLYFVSGARLGPMLVLLPIFGAAIVALAVLSPYRMARITTFLNPEADPLGSSYHIRQALISLGSGGIFGVGLGKSRQKYEYLPEANTDSIFAIVGEETGIVGTFTVTGLFMFVVWRCFKIARRVEDRFGKLLALGIGSWIGIQVLVNIGAMVALVPLTGVPLPLLSYGGSNLVITFAALGMVLNISKKQT